MAEFECHSARIFFVINGRIEFFWAGLNLKKIFGEFIWHQHENEDELFLIVKGKLCLRLRDRDVWLDEGEFFIVPKGIEHKPVAEEEVHLLLFEPISTLNTGDRRHEMTVAELERI